MEKREKRKEKKRVKHEKISIPNQFKYKGEIINFEEKKEKKYNKIIQITKYYVRKYPKFFKTDALILNNYIYLFQNGVKNCIIT